MEFNATEMKELNAALKKAFDEMGVNLRQVQDLAQKALDENSKLNAIEGKTNEKLTELGTNGNKIAEQVKELRTRQLEVEQKLVKIPRSIEGGDAKSIGQMVIESDEFKAVSSGTSGNMKRVNVGNFHKTAIYNATGQNQPLVPADRLGGIIMPGLRRMTVRQLLPQNSTSSNLVEFAKELLYTNAAAPQGGTTSPDTATEGQAKAESALTFELANTPVITIAHWIPASRQVLSDAPMLQGYVDGRLRYGLMLEEEGELMTGTGANGKLNGLINNATAYSYGSTNATVLDTLLKAFLQISLQNLEPTGVVMHPTDWTNLMLLKDTTNRYLFSDPHSSEQPRVWGKDVVVTASQNSGYFLAGAFMLAAEIFDREDASVRVAEQHSTFFIENMVAILAEERLALAIYRAAAIVYGAVSHAG